MWSRRDVVTQVSAMVAAPLILPSGAVAATPSKEPQIGSPEYDSDVDAKAYNPGLVEKQVWTEPRFIGGPRRPERLAEELVRAAREQIGVSEGRNAAQVAKYLNLFISGSPWPYRDAAKTRLQKFCAAGLAWAACQAYYESDDDEKTPWRNDELQQFRNVLPIVNRLFFRVDPSTKIMWQGALHPRRSQPRLRFLGAAAAGTRVKPGWPVLFHWRKKSRNGYYRDPFPNHVGLVESLSGGVLHTIEFNTSSGLGGSQGDGGTVAARERGLDSVFGYAAWY